MVKYIVMFTVLLVSMNVTSYAQDTENTVQKTLGFWVCGGSGNINPDTGSILKSGGEAGMSFSQNFANAEWLTITGSLGVCTGMQGLTNNGGKWVGVNETGHANKATRGALIGAYFEAKFAFSNYFAFDLHSAGSIHLDFKYAFTLPANQRLTLRAYYEVRPLGKAFYQTAADLINDTPVSSILSHMDYRISYLVQFHPEWAYELDTRFRFNGGDDDSLKAVRESFSIRLNNTIYYSNPNGFGGYMQFRYQPENILLGSKSVVHNISLHGGISYSYDLSTL